MVAEPNHVCAWHAVTESIAVLLESGMPEGCSSNPDDHPVDGRTNLQSGTAAPPLLVALLMLQCILHVAPAILWPVAAHVSVFPPILHGYQSVSQCCKCSWCAHIHGSQRATTNLNDHLVLPAAGRSIVHKQNCAKVVAKCVTGRPVRLGLPGSLQQRL